MGQIKQICTGSTIQDLLQISPICLICVELNLEGRNLNLSPSLSVTNKIKIQPSNSTIKPEYSTNEINIVVN